MSVKTGLVTRGLMQNVVDPCGLVSSDLTEPWVTETDSARIVAHETW